MSYRDWQEAAREHLVAVRADGAQLRAELEAIVGELPRPVRIDPAELDADAVEAEIEAEESRNVELTRLLHAAHVAYEREMTPTLLRWIERMRYPSIPIRLWKEKRPKR